MTSNVTSKPASTSLSGGLSLVGDSLEALYRRWEGLRAEHVAALEGFAAERTRLEEEGAFLLGTVRAAREVAPSPGPTSRDVSTGEVEEAAALAVPDELQIYVQEAEARMSSALEALALRAHEARIDLETQLAVARVEVIEALERHQDHATPEVTLRRRPLAGGRAILHLDRPMPDAAMLLAWLLSGKPATRYGFLYDEASDDPQLEPATLYPEEGIVRDEVRPGPGSLRRLLDPGGPSALPVRGIIPFQVQLPGGATAQVQLRCRGPILELEWEEGSGFRSILTAAEAEAAAGALLRLQLTGKLKLQLAAG